MRTYICPWLYFESGLIKHREKSQEDLIFKDEDS
jgi:hypothetical protein